MNIQQALSISTDKLKQKNIPSASLDAEVLLLEALNKNLDKIIIRVTKILNKCLGIKKKRLMN